MFTLFLRHMQKKCSDCSRKLDTKQYHSDGRGGLRLDCKECCNAKKRAREARMRIPKEKIRIEVESKREYLTPEKEIARKLQEPVSIPIEPEENILDQIAKKHQKFITLAISAGRPSTLQIFSDPPRVLKGSTQEILELAMQ